MWRFHDWDVSLSRGILLNIDMVIALCVVCVGCRFEMEQTLLREELARITHREKESVGDDVTPAVLQERARTKEEKKNVQNLVRQARIHTLLTCLNQVKNTWVHPPVVSRLAVLFFAVFLSFLLICLSVSVCHSRCICVSLLTGNWFASCCCSLPGVLSERNGYWVQDISSHPWVCLL